MSRRSLQDIAKFAAGLVAADFLWLVWFSQQGFLPVDFYGTTISPDMVLPGLVFDIALFIILVHYAWHIGKIPAFRERTYLLVAGGIFSIVMVAHLWRVFSGAELLIGPWDVPLWLSWVGVAVTAYLAYSSFHFAARVTSRSSRGR